MCYSFKNKGIILVMIIALFTTMIPNSFVSADENVSPLTDVVMFGVDQSEKSHHVVGNGNTRSEVVSTIVGEFSDAYNVRSVKGKESGFNFDLAVSPNQQVTLEVQEIHTRSEHTLGYWVLIEDQKVYFRTYDESSAGPNHFFIKVPQTLTTGKQRVKVKIVNEGDDKFHIAKMWAYSDFDQLVTDENVYRKMTVTLFRPNIKFSKYEDDLKTVNDLKNKFAVDYKHFNISMATELSVLNYNETTIRERIEWLIRLSKDSGVPFHLNFSSTWASSPGGPDQKGGFFDDVKYQQVAYDPKGEGYMLTIPNHWGNTAWTTMNNEDLNAARYQKFKNAASMVADIYTTFKGNGENVPPVSIFIENEPVYYFPFWHLQGSLYSTADYNSATVAAAEKDGVKLDPTNGQGTGLSQKEYNWMFDNLTHFIGMLADAISKGLGDNAVIVNKGNVELPKDQLKERVFSEQYITAPGLAEERKDTWENALVKNARYGGEWEYIDSRHLDYIAARGVFANVNLERSMLTDFSDVAEAYAWGADHTIVYNFNENGDVSNIKSADEQVDDFGSPTTYNNVFYKEKFDVKDDYDIKENLKVKGNLSASLIDYQGVKWAQSQKYPAFAPISGDQPGTLLFRFDNPEIPNNGLEIGLKGVVTNDPGVSLKVYAGTDPDDLGFVGNIQAQHMYKRWTTIDASDMVKGKDSSKVYVKLELHADGQPGTYLERFVAVSELFAAIPWGAKAGHVNGIEFSAKEKRTQNLWIGYRADVERLMKQYLDKKDGKKDELFYNIETLYLSGRYHTAYDKLVSSISQLLPAKFYVEGFGPLGTYPIDVKLPNDTDHLQLLLLQANQNHVELQLNPDQEMNVAVNLKQLKPNTGYKLTTIAMNHFVIEEAAKGDAAIVRTNDDGEASFNLSAVPEKRVYPRSFSGKLVSYNASRNQIAIMSQEPAFHFSGSVDFKLAKDVKIFRGKDNEQAVPKMARDLRGNDKVDVTLNDNGEIATIYAYYGEETGTVKSFEPLSPNSNGKITFAETGNEYTFRMKASSIKTAIYSGVWAGGKVKFLPGDKLTVKYSPYDNRIIEVKDFVNLEIYRDDFEYVGKTNAEIDNSKWQVKAVQFDNLKAESLYEAGNLFDKGLTTIDKQKPGYVIYEFTMPDGSEFGNFAINYAAAAVGDENNYVKVFAGTDLENHDNWIELGEIRNNDKFNIYNGVDASEIIGGSKKAYVKFTINSSFETWGFLNGFYIKASDHTAPTWQEGGLQAADVTETSVRLIWPKAVDYAGINSYRISKNDTVIATVGSNVNQYVVNNLTGGMHSYKVEASDPSENWSIPLELTISNDTQAPISP